MALTNIFGFRFTSRLYELSRAVIAEAYRQNASDMTHGNAFSIRAEQTEQKADTLAGVRGRIFRDVLPP